MALARSSAQALANIRILIQPMYRSLNRTLAQTVQNIWHQLPRCFFAVPAMCPLRAGLRQHFASEEKAEVLVTMNKDWGW